MFMSDGASWLYEPEGGKHALKTYFFFFQNYILTSLGLFTVCVWWGSGRWKSAGQNVNRFSQISDASEAGCLKYISSDCSQLTFKMEKNNRASAVLMEIVIMDFATHALIINIQK